MTQTILLFFIIQGEVPDQKPLELVEESKNKHQYNVCDTCDGLILITEKDWISKNIFYL